MTLAPVYAALMAQLATAAGFVTKSAVLRHWNDVAEQECPALFLAMAGETPRYATPASVWAEAWTLTPKVFVYVRTPGAVAQTALATALDALRAALLPPQGEARQTLGGACESARIEGTIETDEGTLGDIAMAIVPLRVVV